MLDDLDRRILRQYQGNPRMAIAELAEKSGTTSAVASRRLARMRGQGHILGQEVIVDWHALGFAVEVSLRITLDKTAPRAFDDFLEKARDIPQVIEIQTFLGRVDVRLSVIARDMPDYQHIYRSRILTLPHISDIEALMHVARIKWNEDLPV